jgi:hypothetical protein
MQQECNGKCIYINQRCNGKCADKMVFCSGNCMKTDEIQYCNGKCQSVEKPCNSNCTGRLTFKCGPKCLAQGEADNYYECRGRCFPIKYQCRGQKCPPQAPKKCGGEYCLPENDVDYQDINGRCISSDVFCGKCRDHLPHKCTRRCFNPNATSILDNSAGNCKGGGILKENECEELCVSEADYRENYQECNGKCISKDLPCKS